MTLLTEPIDHSIPAQIKRTRERLAQLTKISRCAHRPVEGTLGGVIQEERERKENPCPWESLQGRRESRIP